MILLDFDTLVVERKSQSLLQALFMMPYTSILLLLFVFSFFKTVQSVCTICFDNAQPPNHATVDCPFTTVVAANAAAAAGAALTVTQLLGIKLTNFLTKPVLDRISNLRQKADPFTPYDCTNKTSAQITQAVGNGLLPTADAAAYAADLMEDADAALNKRGSAIYQYLMMKNQDLPAAQAQVRTGCLLYIFAKSSEYVVATSTAAKKFSIGDSSTLSKLSAVLTPPKTEAAFHHTLQVFAQILHATGVVTFLLSSKFLADVVYTPMATKGYSFMMAFCNTYVYLSRVEDPTLGVVNIGNVSEHGAVDSLREDAILLGTEMYGKAFRKLRVEPSDPPHGGATSTNDDVEWNTKFSKDNKSPCHAYTFGMPHKPASLLPDGTCKYNHKCIHWVSDKGKNGQCGGAHRKDSCKNSAKCDNPEP